MFHLLFATHLQILFFWKNQKQLDYLNLKGHRSVGGMRASTYNAMPVEGINELIAFMKEFEAKHG